MPRDNTNINNSKKYAPLAMIIIAIFLSLAFWKYIDNDDRDLPGKLHLQFLF